MVPTAWLLLAACALHAHREGIVSPHGERVEIWENDGRRTRLVLGEGSEPIRYLDGVVVEVEGPRFGRRVVVQDWTVGLTDTGAMPFVGVLTLYGSNWLIEDRVSGGTVLLDPATLLGLEAHKGQPVLVEGFVAGPQRIRVVRWRALYGGPPGVPAAG